LKKLVEKINSSQSDEELKRNADIFKAKAEDSFLLKDKKFIELAKKLKQANLVNVAKTLRHFNREWFDISNDLEDHFNVKDEHNISDILKKAGIGEYYNSTISNRIKKYL
jgi:hypothetical protein